MKCAFLGPQKAHFFISRAADCEKTTRTISKISKDPESTRASSETNFFILVSEFGKMLFRNILEIISKLRNREILVSACADCEKTTRTISKIPKDSERARASPKILFFYFGLRLREVVVSQHFRSGCFKDFEFYISYRRISLQPL